MMPICASSLAGDQLADARDLERRALDQVSEVGKRQLGVTRHHVAYDAGPRDGHVDAHLGLAAAVQRAGHEGVVLGHVAEGDDLGAADRVVVGRAPRHVEQHPGHPGNGVHVDARSGGGHVDRRADAPCLGDGLGDGVDQGGVVAREALLDQGREAADEVDAYLGRRGVEGMGDRDEGRAVAGGDHVGDRRDRHPATDDRHAVLVLELERDRHEAARPGEDLVVDALADPSDVARGAVA
jgi:hypothetical protein